MALIAQPFTEALTADLIDLLRTPPDDRAEMAAWALGFGEIPGHLRISTVQSLLEVLADPARPEGVRGHAAEAIAEMLDFSDAFDPGRLVAEAR